MWLHSQHRVNHLDFTDHSPILPTAHPFPSENLHTRVLLSEDAFLRKDQNSCFPLQIHPYTAFLLDRGIPVPIIATQNDFSNVLKQSTNSFLGFDRLLDPNQGIVL